MKIPSFVGPLVSTILFLMVVFGFCFYYCYWKPKRQRKKSAECNKNNTATGSPSLTSCPSRTAKKKSLFDEECSYGYNSTLSPYSAGYCFHGGFPMVNPTCYEQTWQSSCRKMKYQAPICKVNTEQSKKAKGACCELRVDVVKERSKTKPCVARQFSSESHGPRNVCHLQVIQECEEEKEENEEVSEINNKDLENGECNIVAT